MPDVWWYDRGGQWCADVPDDEKSGKRKRLYLGKDKKQAQEKLHRYLAEYYSENRDARRKTKALTLQALTARFLQWAETNLSESTQDIYARQLKPFVEKHGKRPVDDISPSDVEQRKAAIKKAGNKPRTINFFVQSIKRLYSWALEQGLIDEDPIKNVSRVPKAPPKDRSLSDEEVHNYLKYAKESQPLADISEVLLLTGMRVGELLGLKWKDIDRQTNIARIFDHKTANRGEGRPRTIPLCSRALQIIDRQPQVSSYIFTGERGQKLTYNAIKCRRDKLERKYEKMPHVTFHQFRHTAATRMARAGVPERVASEILGHSSKLMTRYYTTTSTDEMLDAVEKIDTGVSDEEGQA